MRQIIAFLAIGLVLFLGLNRLSEVFPERQGDLTRMHAALSRVPGRQAVTLGGSIGADVDYAAMCLDGADFYWDSQDLFEVAAFADLMLDRPAPPRYWLVMAAPTAEGIDNGSKASGRAGHRRLMHRFLAQAGKPGLINGDWREAFLATAVPALRDDVWRPHLLALAHLAGVGPGPAPASAGARPRALLRLDPAVSAATAPADVQRRAERLARIAYYDPHVPEQSTEALLRMNARIRARGGTMILVVPPMPTTVREATIKGLGPTVRDFNHRLERLARAGVVIVDHWADPAFAGRYELFQDNEHLNHDGAALFSRRLAEDLRARGVLPAAACPTPAPHPGLPADREVR